MLSRARRKPADLPRGLTSVACHECIICYGRDLAYFYFDAHQRRLRQPAAAIRRYLPMEYIAAWYMMVYGEADISDRWRPLRH